MFNRNTIKILYTCMPHLEKEISKHNKKEPSEFWLLDDKIGNCVILESNLIMTNSDFH